MRIDLDGIWGYIAEDSIDAADQWLGRLLMHLTPLLIRQALATSAKT
jgi:hypothetical protein